MNDEETKTSKRMNSEKTKRRKIAKIFLKLIYKKAWMQIVLNDLTITL